MIKNGRNILKQDKKIIEKFFEAKRQRRRQLANIPIQEKVKILVKLQKMAIPVLVARGIQKKVWEL